MSTASLTVDPRLHAIYDDLQRGRYRYPTQEQILAYGGMDEPGRAALLDRAAQTGMRDAKEGALMHDVLNSPNLEALLSEIPEGMDRVIGKREQIEADVKLWTSQLRAAAKESEAAGQGEPGGRSQATTGMPDDPGSDPAGVEGVSPTASATEAEYHLMRFRADVHALGSGARGKGMVVIGILAALAGIAVDSVLLGAAIEATEMFNSMSSQVLGFVASLFLGLVAFLCGFFTGRSRRAGRLSQERVPQGLWAQHNDLEVADARKRKPFLILAFVTAAVIVTVLAALWVLRYVEWRNASETMAEGDARASSIYVQAAILLLALLSLVIFWYEGYHVSMERRKAEAQRVLQEHEKAMAALSERSKFAPIFIEQAEENQQDLAHLDSDIARAVQSLERLFHDVIDRYKGAAINWLNNQKDSPLQRQIPIFDSIGDSVRTLEERLEPFRAVREYLAMPPTSRQRSLGPSHPGPTDGGAL